MTPGARCLAKEIIPSIIRDNDINLNCKLNKTSLRWNTEIMIFAGLTVTPVPTSFIPQERQNLNNTDIDVNAHQSKACLGLGDASSNNMQKWKFLLWERGCLLSSLLTSATTGVRYMAEKEEHFPVVLDTARLVVKRVRMAGKMRDLPIHECQLV